MTTIHDRLAIFNSIEVHPVDPSNHDEIVAGMVSIAQMTGRPVAWKGGKLAVTPDTKVGWTCTPDPTKFYS